MADNNDKFLSKYNEIIFENLDAILRQNMMFQTQISFLEEAVKDKEQLEKNLYAKETEIDLTSELAHLKSELKDKEEILAISGDGSPDAHRLQNALNTQMKDATIRKRQIANLESEKIVDKRTISEQRKYIQKLEKMLPKEKKIVRQDLHNQKCQVQRTTFPLDQAKQDLIHQFVLCSKYHQGAALIPIRARSCPCTCHQTLMVRSYLLQ